jgi:hypothetical protein
MNALRILTLICSLPAFAMALSLPQVADFSHGRMDLLAPATQGSSLQNHWSADSEGAFLILDAGSLRLPLVPGGERLGGPQLDLENLPYSRSLVLVWQAPNADARLNVCLVDDHGHRRCALLRAKRAGWQESSVGFPGTVADTNVPPVMGKRLRAGSVELQLLDAGVSLGLREMRLDPPAETISVEAVAAAFGGSPAQVRSLRKLGLPENLVWVLQRVLQACACKAADIAKERATKSWGEIAQAHGLEWTALIADVEARQQAAGLPPVPPSPWQEERSWINADLSELRP